MAKCREPCPDLFQDCPKIHITEEALNRILLGAPPEEFVTKFDGDYGVCEPSRASKNEAFCENFNDSHGINRILEDGIDHYAYSVEKRAAALTSLGILCFREKTQVKDCYLNNRECSIACAPYVQSFIKCLRETGRDILDRKVKQIRDDNDIWNETQKYTK